MICSNPIMGIIFLIFLIILKYIISNNINSKIVIENSIIKKINLYRKPIELGSVSEITSYSIYNMKVTVLKNEKDYFSFLIRGRENNFQFFNYLKNNYKESLRITGMKSFALFFFIYALSFFWMLPGIILEGEVLALIITTVIFIVFYCSLWMNIKNHFIL